MTNNIRVVPADFEDKLLVHLREQFISDEDPESEKTISVLIEYIQSMFVNMEYSKDKPASQVSAYTMFRRSKDGGDWSTMSEEEKLTYRILADEENVKRGSKNKNEISKRVSCITLFKKEFPDGDWKELSEMMKEDYKKKAKNINSLLPAKIDKQSFESKAYNVGLRYLKKTFPNQKFYTWSKLDNEIKERWIEFVRNKLFEDMNKDLYRELIYSMMETNYLLYTC